MRDRMRMSIVLALAVVASVAQQPLKTAVATELLGAERMGIYRSFLDAYNNGVRSTLNMGQSTVAFKPREFDKSCLTPFTPEELATQSLHNFASDSFAGHNVRLVDPATHKRQDPDEALLRGSTVDQAVTDGFAAGVFTFSEIVLDASHTHAAFSYSFVCGRLCGNGATVLYELQAGKWVPSKAKCSSWNS